jgi:hypothetical protein
MKKLIAVSVAALMLGALLPATAGAAKKKAKPQVVEGTILAPQGGNAAATCVYRAQRTLFSAGGPNGIFGHTFEVDPKTVGKPFTLEAADGSGMDISFYTDLGDPTDPTTAPANLAFEEAGPGGEKGVVPEGFPIAFVCMTEGVNAGFTYTAG